MEKTMPLGYEQFSEIRSGNYYYVDKTGFISELLHKDFKANLITRPRRFGKTLTMTMLEDFFDISRDSRKHFEGLEITSNSELCRDYQNQWPVIFLTLKDAAGSCFADAYAQLAALISDFCIAHDFLAESERVNEQDRKLACRFMEKQASREEMKNSLFTLTRMMSSHYGKNVILLLDEYDVPLEKAGETGYYAQMLDVLRAMISKALKTNPYLKFAVVTGCLRVSKESIFTGTNHFVPDTMIDDRFNEYIGFTEKDVRRILEDTGLSGHAQTVREWYDGYHFGHAEVYCPWDVLNYVSALQGNPDAKPKAYWANTSENSILRKLLKKAGRTTRMEIEKLINGESIRKKITDQMTYEDLYRDIEHIWNILYLTGYLTGKPAGENGLMELAIPNREIREIYLEQISGWFTETIVFGQHEKWNCFCKALESGNGEKAQELFNAFLDRGISIRDTAVPKSRKENFYHGVLLGLLMSRDEWCVTSNQENGDGYTDIHVEIGEDTALVIEVKYAENDALVSGCQDAMKQIEKKRYARALKDIGFSTVYAYGIACHKKHCRIQTKQY